MVVDGLDREAVIAAVLAEEPEVIVHQMTALAGMRSLRNPDKGFAATNELRTRGTDNLLAAAALAGTRRVIAQSYAGPGPDKHSGGALKTEEDPDDWQPIRSAAQMPAAITYVDKTVTLEAEEGIVLRYGSFYGPGASEILLDMVRKRQLPVVGVGTGVWSFIEITDAAGATIAAVSDGAPGVYNVVDDDLAPVAEWLPYLAKVLGAKPPLRVPAWLGRLLAGEFVVAQMTTSRGSSNAKARKELGKTEVNCRQIFARARQRIAAGGQVRDSAPSPTRRAEGEELARRFFEAAAGGDMDGLLGMLAPDVVLHADGGGKAQAIGKPLHGRQRSPGCWPACSAEAGPWAPPSGWPGSTASRARSVTTPKGACSACSSSTSPTAWSRRSALWSIPTSLVISDRCLMWLDCRRRNYRHTETAQTREETDERLSGCR